MPPPQHVPITLEAGKEPTKRTLRHLISTFLPTEWAKTNPEDVQALFQADYTNPHCTVSRPSSSTAPNTEPLKVFIKFYKPGGGIPIFEQLAPSREQEAEFCYQYGLSGRGAKVYGVFETDDGTLGRIDEFLDARNLEPEDVEDEGIRDDIAVSMATFHTLKTSLPSKPVAQYYDALIPGLQIHQGSENLKRLANEAGFPLDNLIDYDFASRVTLIVNAMDSIKAKSAWCIHDVQYMNTMIRHSPRPHESKVLLIDFELVMRNYRGLDIGGHYMQKLFKWFDTTNKIANCRPYTEDEKRHFCEHYAKTWNKITGDENTGEQVLKESEYGYLLAIAFDLHNMLWYMDKTGNQDVLDLKGLEKLFEEFKMQYRKLWLQEPV